jgi:hypothetical protein
MALITHDHVASAIANAREVGGYKMVCYQLRQGDRLVEQFSEGQASIYVGPTEVDFIQAPDGRVLVEVN